MPQANRRMKDIEVPGTRQFANRVDEFPDAVDLTLGQPDFETPQAIKNAAIEAIDTKSMKYSHNTGLFELRETISQYYREKYEAEYDPNGEVLVTVGGSEGIDAILRAILDPGDEVLIPAPTYLGYEPIVELSGGVTKFVDMTKTDFITTPELIESNITERTKAIILNYPTNPTGVTYTREQMDALVEVFRKHDIFIITDEIYAENTLEGEHISLSSYTDIKEKVLVVNGLSKSHAMTGWRIGYVVGDRAIMEDITAVHLYNTICAAIPSQYAAIEALKNQRHVPGEMNKAYIERRDYIYKRLIDMGLEVSRPTGAFYIFPSIRKYEADSFKFATDLLESVQLAVVPGRSFSEYGEGHIRLSFACSMEELTEAADRLEQYINMLEDK
ncbi:aminotransferase class I/II-fold pyridoxal phosphate-dependent enzyme [Salinicoccus sp. ID82-1]|uniref:aminotransferase class I/II-fold pyridoxal phosphate-dependent enzyme n=1 Tax=Salinicoccus sp. ID82-1 TaxID=2820269 RepID=UPI001F00D49E|nr:aminotransferase class I/II-fold pyridoxal phosphate-dependent enzyme [Salinicoccus sp. ID82-1]MCG1009695.1 aminotransferase class I/II-fold pyridoxal phosphate-dependent enzyme [Salinicoccus sp. ID82-1]